MKTDRVQNHGGRQAVLTLMADLRIESELEGFDLRSFGSRISCSCGVVIFTSNNKKHPSKNEKFPSYCIVDGNETSRENAKFKMIDQS